MTGIQKYILWACVDRTPKRKVEIVTGLNASSNRRCRDWLFPSDWTKGFYAIIKLNDDGQQFKLCQNKQKGKSKMVPKSLLKCMAEKDDGLYVVSNFSETFATVHSSPSGCRICLVSALIPPEPLFEDSPAHLQKMSSYLHNGVQNPAQKPPILRNIDVL